MNSSSSRSHLVSIITVHRRIANTGEIRTGKLHLVDLAGSEKVRRTKVEGERLEEAKNINSSLSTLGKVIHALTDGRSTHVPYRDSKLTRLLQESLGGNARTALVIACSGNDADEDETLSSLRFGQRAKRIRNRPVINAELGAAEMRERLAKAESERDALKQQLAAMGGEGGAEALAEDERSALTEQMASLREKSAAAAVERAEVLEEKEVMMEQLAEAVLAQEALEAELARLRGELQTRTEERRALLEEKEVMMEQLVQGLLTQERLEGRLEAMVPAQAEQAQAEQAQTEARSVLEEPLPPSSSRLADVPAGESREGDAAAVISRAASPEPDAAAEARAAEARAAQVEARAAAAEAMAATEKAHAAASESQAEELRKQNGNLRRLLRTATDEQQSEAARCRIMREELERLAAVKERLEGERLMLEEMIESSAPAVEEPTERPLYVERAEVAEALATELQARANELQTQNEAAEARADELRAQNGSLRRQLGAATDGQQAEETRCSRLAEKNARLEQLLASSTGPPPASAPPASAAHPLESERERTSTGAFEAAELEKRAQLMRDLQGKCERMVELELELDEERSRTRMLHATLQKWSEEAEQDVSAGLVPEGQAKLKGLVGWLASWVVDHEAEHQRAEVTRPRERRVAPSRVTPSSSTLLGGVGIRMDSMGTANGVASAHAAKRAAPKAAPRRREPPMPPPLSAWSLYPSSQQPMHFYTEGGVMSPAKSPTTGGTVLRGGGGHRVAGRNSGFASLPEGQKTTKEAPVNKGAIGVASLTPHTWAWFLS